MEVFTNVEGLLKYIEGSYHQLRQETPTPSELPLFFRQKRTVDLEGNVEFIPKLDMICYCGKPLNPKFVLDSIIRQTHTELTFKQLMTT